MSKTKNSKIIIGIVIAIVILLIAVCSYIVFGVIGIESKREYPNSDIVSSNVDTNKTIIDNKTTSLENIVSTSYDVYTTDETKDLEKSVSAEKEIKVLKNSVVTVVLK